MKPLFSGELQLLRWSDTSSNGATVTFQLADVTALERFKDLTLAKKGMAGQIIAAVMMLVDESEAAPEPGNMPEPAREAPTPRPGDLCIMACHFCADPQFWQWANCSTLSKSYVLNEEDAKKFVLCTCDVDSRKKLDGNKIASTRFLTLIREPFLAWKAQQ